VRSTVRSFTSPDSTRISSWPLLGSCTLGISPRPFAASALSERRGGRWISTNETRMAPRSRRRYPCFLLSSRATRDATNEGQRNTRAVCDPRARPTSTVETHPRDRSSSHSVFHHCRTHSHVAWFSYLLIPTLCFVPFTLSFRLCVICVCISINLCVYLDCTYISSDLSSIMYALQCQRGTIHEICIRRPVSLLVRETSDSRNRERERSDLSRGGSKSTSRDSPDLCCSMFVHAANNPSMVPL